MGGVNRRDLLFLLGGFGLSGIIGGNGEAVAGEDMLDALRRGISVARLRDAAHQFNMESDIIAAKQVILGILSAMRNREESLSHLQGLRQDDFRAKRWSIWNGWRLSHTEAALVVLLAEI